MLNRIYFEPGTRLRGDEFLPVIIEWRESVNFEQKLASVKIIANAPQMTRKAARQYARTIIKGMEAEK
jgi:hypothetical protein